MAKMPDSMRLPPEAEARLRSVQADAKVRHEKNRRNAAKQGRKDFPLLPYECSWAYEQKYFREYSRG